MEAKKYDRKHYLKVVVDNTTAKTGYESHEYEHVPDGADCRLHHHTDGPRYDELPDCDYSKTDDDPPNYKDWSQTIPDWCPSD